MSFQETQLHREIERISKISDPQEFFLEAVSFALATNDRNLKLMLRIWNSEQKLSSGSTEAFLSNLSQHKIV